MEFLTPCLMVETFQFQSLFVLLTLVLVRLFCAYFSFQFQGTSNSFHQACLGHRRVMPRTSRCVFVFQFRLHPSLKIVPYKVFNESRAQHINPCSATSTDSMPLYRKPPPKHPFVSITWITGPGRLSRPSICWCFCTGFASKRNTSSHAYDFGGCYHTRKNLIHRNVQAPCHLWCMS